MAITPRTRPSSQPLAAPNPRLDPNAFGAGVGVALQNASAAMDDFVESEVRLVDAYAAREARSNTFRDLRSLSSFKLESQTRLTELTEEVGPDGKGYTNRAREELERRQKEWLATVSPENLEEMTFRSGTLIDDMTSSAFKWEYKAQQNFFVQQLDLSANQALSDIYTDPDAADEHIIRVLEEINTSDLPAAEKEALAIKFRGAAAAAEAGKRIELNALSEGTIGPADGSDIVAAGLPVVSRGLLNAVASVEADGYNVLNGGATFEGYAQHPGIVGEGGESTAAGRYQFVAGTWQRVSQAINAPSFAPEWQDRGAWWLAKNDFKARTGKDLYTELMSGDRERIIAVKHALQGQGMKNVTWKGLQDMSDDKWANYILGSHGVGGGMPEGEVKYPAGPALFDDPRYAMLPFETKLALAQDAELRADAARAAASKEETEQYQKWFNELEFSIGDGTKGLADIQAALDQNLFREFAHAERLMNIYGNRTKGQEDLIYGVTKLASPGSTFSWDSADDRNSLNALVRSDNGLVRLEQKDEAYVTDAIAPLVQQAQDIPTEVAGTLSALTRSADQGQMQFAFETLRQLEALAPAAFRHRLDESVERDYQLYKGMRDVLPADEVMNRIRNVREFRQQHAVLMDEVDTALKGETFRKLIDKAVDDISTEFINDPDLPLVPMQRAAFQLEYKALYRDGYARSGDPAVAAQFATNMLKRSWAPFEFGGRYALMKDAPPTKGYKTVDQSYDWMTAQIEAEHPELAEAKWYQLVPDTQTRNEYEALRQGKRDKLPSYLLYQQDSEGNIGAVLGDDNQPVRWRGDAQPAEAEFRARTEAENTRVLQRELELKKQRDVEIDGLRLQPFSATDQQTLDMLNEEVELLDKADRAGEMQTSLDDLNKKLERFGVLSKREQTFRNWLLNELGETDAE